MTHSAGGLPPANNENTPPSTMDLSGLKIVLEELAKRRRVEIQAALRTIKGHGNASSGFNKVINVKNVTESRADAERIYWILHHVIARGRSVVNQILALNFKFGNMTELNLLKDVLNLATATKKDIEAAIVIGKGKAAVLNTFKNYLAKLVEKGEAELWLKNVTEEGLKGVNGQSNRLYQLLTENKATAAPHSHINRGTSANDLIETPNLELDSAILKIATSRKDLFSSKQLQALQTRRDVVVQAQEEEMARVITAVRSRHEELIRVRGAAEDGVHSPVGESVSTNIKSLSSQWFVPEEEDPASSQTLRLQHLNRTATVHGGGSDILVQCGVADGPASLISSMPQKTVDYEVGVFGDKMTIAKNIFLNNGAYQQYNTEKECNTEMNYLNKNPSSLNLTPSITAPTIYKPPSTQKQEVLASTLSTGAAGASQRQPGADPSTNENDDNGEWVTASQKKGGSSSKWSSTGSKQSVQKSSSITQKAPSAGRGDAKSKGENNERWRCQNGASCYWLKKGPDVCRYYHPPEEIAAVARAKLSTSSSGKGEKVRASATSARESVTSVKSESGGSRVEKTLRISPSVVGWIIGKGGKTILNLKEESGAGVWIDQESMDNEDMRIVYITGSAESVEKAITMVKDLVEAAPGISPGSIVEETVETEEKTPTPPQPTQPATRAVSAGAADPPAKPPAPITSRVVSDSFSSVVSSLPTAEGSHQAQATKKATAAAATTTTTSPIGSGMLGGVQKAPPLDKSAPKSSSMPLSTGQTGPPSGGSGLLLDNNFAPSSLAPGSMQQAANQNAAIQAPAPVGGILQRPITHVSSQPTMSHFTLSLGELSPFVATPTNAPSLIGSQGIIGSPPPSAFGQDPGQFMDPNSVHGMSSMMGTALNLHDGSQHTSGETTPPEPTSRAKSPLSTSSTSDVLLSFLQSQKSCLKGTPESFYQWLKDSEDIDNISDLADAVLDEDYVREVLQPGDGTVGLKGFKRTVFKKAVLVAVGITVEGRSFPPELICPIAQVLMKDDPVIAADGHTYERTAIESWYDVQQAELNAAAHELQLDPSSQRAQAIMNRGILSPVTHLQMNSLQLIPNHVVRAMAQDLS